jgi:hypothetical protein
MEPKEELSDILTEILRLKQQLNKIYDENNQISGKMLEVSAQLDRKINVYLKENMKKQQLSGIKRQ